MSPQIWAGGHRRGAEATLPSGSLAWLEPARAGRSETSVSPRARQGTQNLRPPTCHLPGAREAEKDGKVDTEEAGSL